MSADLRIEASETHGQAAVITIAGDLDRDTAPTLYQQACMILNDHPTVILDVGGLRFCDSSGLNALLRLRRRARDLGGQLILAAPPAPFLRLLAMTGADSVFPIHDSLSGAKAAHLGDTNGPST